MAELRFGPGTRCVLFGGGRLLLRTAQGLAARGIGAVAVCGPAHAREEFDGAPLAAALAALGVRVVETEQLDVARLAPLVDAHTLGLSVAAPWIFRADVIALFGGRLLNLHGADLPNARGGGGFTWQILRGDRRGGLTWHVLTEAVDEGDVVLQHTFTYPDSCRTPADFALHREPHEMDFLTAFLDAVASGRPLAVTPQDGARASYWPRLSTAVHGWIDWRWEASEIVRFVDAFGPPYAGAGTQLRGAELRIVHAELDGRVGAFHPFQAGLVFRVHDGVAWLAARGGAVLVHAVRDAAGSDAFARLRPGVRLHTPAAVLDRARSARAVMTSGGLEIRD